MNSESKGLKDKDGRPVKLCGRPEGMLVEVTKLRCRGVRISAEELKTKSIRCKIFYLRNTSDYGMAFKFRSIAEIIDDQAISGGSAGTPLFDPFVEDWTGDGIILSGWEINQAEDGAGSVQHYQAWLVKPLPSAPISR
jgi:hypothetical protein